jgi:hypothetical protein
VLPPCRSKASQFGENTPSESGSRARAEHGKSANDADDETFQVVRFHWEPPATAISHPGRNGVCDSSLNHRTNARIVAIICEDPRFHVQEPQIRLGL